MRSSIDMDTSCMYQVEYIFYIYMKTHYYNSVYFVYFG